MHAHSLRPAHATGETPAVTPIALRSLLAPTVTATPLTAPIGVAVDATITASGWPIPSIAVENLPAGLTLVDNRDGTARVTGIPTAAGSFTLIVVAENTTGTTRTPWAIDVTEAPAFTSTAFEQIVTAAVELLAEPAPPAGTARLALPTLIPRASTAPPRSPRRRVAAPAGAFTTQEIRTRRPA